MAATIGLIEMRSWGLMVSVSFRLMRSFAMRSMREKAVLSVLVMSSPTERTRRFPR